MPVTNRKFAIAYVFLVLLPVAGLAGILRYGRNLTAPISVDGTWTLRADPAQLSALPCGKSLAASQAFTISQSGKIFTLTLPGNSKGILGQIEGSNLSAQLPSSMSGSGCGGDLMLIATVDHKTEPRSLAGTLSVNGCSSCTPVEFHAVRDTPTAKSH